MRGRHGTIKVLDFKRPDSSYYRIRFLFEEDYYCLHISGDLGSLTAANCKNMTYEKFAEDYAGNPSYFREKVECHNRPFFVFDENMAKALLKEYLDESGVLAEVLRDGRMDWETDDDKLNDFFLRTYFLILRIRKGSGPPDMRLWNGTFRIRGNLLPRLRNRKRIFWNCTCMPFRWQKHRLTRKRIHPKKMKSNIITTSSEYSAEVFYSFFEKDGIHRRTSPNITHTDDKSTKNPVFPYPY